MRLTELAPELLELVDEGKIAMRPAVELSYLNDIEQQDLIAAISDADATPSHAQAIKMRNFSKEGKLNPEVIESIMLEEKPNQRPKISFKYEELKKYTVKKKRNVIYRHVGWLPCCLPRTFIQLIFQGSNGNHIYAIRPLICCVGQAADNAFHLRRFPSILSNIVSNLVEIHAKLCRTNLVDAASADFYSHI